MNKNNLTICCLPVAGLANPYQHLMMAGLNKSPGIKAIHGYPGRFFAFYRTAKKFKPEYIHLDWIEKYYIRKYGWLTTLCWPLFLLDLYLVKRFTKTKFAWTFHNLKPHNRNQQKWGMKAYKRFGKSCAWIRVFDQNTIEKACTLYGFDKNKFKVIPEGSYVGYYKSNSPQKSQARQQLTFLYLGHIKPYKGVLESIAAIRNLKFDNWRYQIIGKCSDKNYLQSIIKEIDQDDRITINDIFIEDDKLGEYFHGADFVFLPFRDIENSGSLILAMGFKKAIIAPNTGVVSRRLKQQSHLLYDKTITELSETLEKITREEVDQIGESNYEALKQFEWSDFAEAFR